VARQTMMNNESSYHIAGDTVYILIGPKKLEREKENLTLTVQLAREKINALQPILDGLVNGSDEYDRLRKRINDYKMLISDCKDRFEDLLNIPK
jgi:hypothetical protein